MTEESEHNEDIFEERRNDKGQFTRQTSLRENHQKIFEDYKAFAKGGFDKETTERTRLTGVRFWLQYLQENNTDPFESERTDAAQYLSDIMGQYADTTIGSLFSSVSVFYSWAVEMGHINKNPCADIDITKAPYNIDPQNSHYVKVHRRKGQKNIKSLPKNKVIQLFENAGSPPFRNELLIKLAWETACRCDELSRLKVDSIDMNDKSIYLRSAKLSSGQELYQRYVYFDWDVDTEYLMREWLNRRREALLNSENDEGYLFVGQNTQQLNSSYISRIIKEAGHRAGINEPLLESPNGGVQQWLVTGHRIRHSSISYQANHTNISLNSIRRVAGHQQLSTTQDYITTPWDTVRQEYRTS